MTTTDEAAPRRRHSESRRLTEQIGLRLSPAEKAAVTAAAAKRKLAVPDLLRVCLAAQGIEVKAMAAGAVSAISTVSSAYQRAS